MFDIYIYIYIYIYFSLRSIMSCTGLGLRTSITRLLLLCTTLQSQNTGPDGPRPTARTTRRELIASAQRVAAKGGSDSGKRTTPY